MLVTCICQLVIHNMWKHKNIFFKITFLDLSPYPNLRVTLTNQLPVVLPVIDPFGQKWPRPTIKPI